MRNILLLLPLVSLLSLHCSGQQIDAEIETLRRQLAQGSTTAEAILTSPQYMHLHASTPFRQLIKAHAPTGQLTIVTPHEPGTRVQVHCTLTDRQGQPNKNALVYVYQTSNKGWYSDTAAHILINSGDYNHARLFGYVRTDEKGEFILHTIQPVGYPNSNLPAHIHIQAWQGTAVLAGLPDELLFDNDPRLTPARRQAAQRSGYLIATNTGTANKPIFVYTVRQR